MTPYHPESYLAFPKDGYQGRILVLHAWWGLTSMIADVCDRLAGEGFIAYAQDLFHGEVATTIAEAATLSSQFPEMHTRSHISRAAELLWGTTHIGDRGLGVVGFSFGAHYALKLSVEVPEIVSAVVAFYGTARADFSRSRAAYLGHFAQVDPYEPAEEVEWLESALKASGRPTTFYRYEGVGHWFFEHDQPSAYNEEAAHLAWERTVSFLKDRLLAPPPNPAV